LITVADDYDGEVAELQAIAAHDEDAFTRWFARHDIALKRSLRSFAAIVDVEAIVQETAIRVWSHASSITADGRPGFLVRWAATVARNMARTEARRSGRLQFVESPPETPAPVDHPPDPAFTARAQRCFKQLSPKLRLAMERVRDHGGSQSLRDVAAAIGMTHDSIRQNLTRARRALEECLESHGIDVRSYLR
jgi:RNA polymerase sigma-70 factor (ECF subfamily)